MPGTDIAKRLGERGGSRWQEQSKDQRKRGRSAAWVGFSSTSLTIRTFPGKEPQKLQLETVMGKA